MVTISFSPRENAILIFVNIFLMCQFLLEKFFFCNMQKPFTFTPFKHCLNRVYILNKGWMNVNPLPFRITLLQIHERIQLNSSLVDIRSKSSWIITSIHNINRISVIQLNILSINIKIYMEYGYLSSV